MQNNSAEVRPYSDSREKKEQVESMFDSIAPRYDRLNQLLSLGIHHGWRKKAVRQLLKNNPEKVLDLATGTGDFAVEIARNGVNQIVAADISEGMMEIGKKKIAALGLKEVIHFTRGDAEQLSFESNSFDAVSIAFGVRNFQELKKGLSEMNRVVRPGGVVVILEFSKAKGWFRPFYNFYFRFIVPGIGRFISGDSAAYSYLPQSVAAFPDGKEFLHILRECGFSESNLLSLTFNVATIYVAKK